MLRRRTETTTRTKAARYFGNGPSSSSSQPPPSYSSMTSFYLRQRCSYCTATSSSSSSSNGSPPPAGTKKKIAIGSLFKKQAAAGKTEAAPATSSSSSSFAAAAARNIKGATTTTTTTDDYKPSSIDGLKKGLSKALQGIRLTELWTQIPEDAQDDLLTVYRNDLRHTNTTTPPTTTTTSSSSESGGGGRGMSGADNKMAMTYVLESVRKADDETSHPVPVPEGPHALLYCLMQMQIRHQRQQRRELQRLQQQRAGAAAAAPSLGSSSTSVASDPSHGLQLVHRKIFGEERDDEEITVLVSSAFAPSGSAAAAAAAASTVGGAEAEGDEELSDAAALASALAHVPQFRELLVRKRLRFHAVAPSPAAPSRSARTHQQQRQSQQRAAGEDGEDNAPQAAGEQHPEEGCEGGENAAATHRKPIKPGGSSSSSGAGASASSSFSWSPTKGLSSDEIAAVHEALRGTWADVHVEALPSTEAAALQVVFPKGRFHAVDKLFYGVFDAGQQQRHFAAKPSNFLTFLRAYPEKYRLENMSSSFSGCWTGSSGATSGSLSTNPAKERCLVLSNRVSSVVAEVEAVLTPRDPLLLWLKQQALRLASAEIYAAGSNDGDSKSKNKRKKRLAAEWAAFPHGAFPNVLAEGHMPRALRRRVMTDFGSMEFAVDRLLRRYGTGVKSSNNNDNKDESAADVGDDGDTAATTRRTTAATVHSCSALQIPLHFDEYTGRIFFCPSSSFVAPTTAVTAAAAGGGTLIGGLIGGLVSRERHERYGSPELQYLVTPDRVALMAAVIAAQDDALVPDAELRTHATVARLVEQLGDRIADDAGKLADETDGDDDDATTANHNNNTSAVTFVRVGPWLMELPDAPGQSALDTCLSDSVIGALEDATITNEAIAPVTGNMTVEGMGKATKATKHKLNMARLSRGEVPMSAQMLVPLIPTYYVPLDDIVKGLPEGYTSDHLLHYFSGTGTLEFVTLVGKTFVRMHGGRNFVNLNADGADQAEAAFRQYKPDGSLVQYFYQVFGKPDVWLPLEQVVYALPEHARDCLSFQGPHALLYFAGMQHVFGFTANEGGKVCMPRRITHLSVEDTPVPRALQNIRSNFAANGLTVKEILERASPYSRREIVAYFGGGYGKVPAAGEAITATTEIPVVKKQKKQRRDGGTEQEKEGEEEDESEVEEVLVASPGELERSMRNFIECHQTIFHVDFANGIVTLQEVHRRNIAESATLEQQFEVAKRERNTKRISQLAKKIAVQNNPGIPYLDDKEKLVEALLNFLPDRGFVRYREYLRSLPMEVRAFLPKNAQKFFHSRSEFRIFAYQRIINTCIQRSSAKPPDRGMLRSNFAEEELLMIIAQIVGQAPLTTQMLSKKMGHVVVQYLEDHKAEFPGGLFGICSKYPQYFQIVFRNASTMDCRSATITLICSPPIGTGRGMGEMLQQQQQEQSAAPAQTQQQAGTKADDDDDDDSEELDSEDDV